MILEIHDLLENEHVITHTQPLPPGTTLGYVFEQDSRLRNIALSVMQVKVNGMSASNWKAYSPAKTDRITIVVGPREPFSLGAVLAAVQVALAVVSVVQFIVSLFNQPKPQKLNSPKDSPTYSFDGIKTSFSPGGPVPVNYGEHMLGGQLLGMAVDIQGNRNDVQQLSMLIGLGVGPITDVNCVKINGVPFENFSDTASWEWRAGYSSQAVLSGFETVRNTFADGREISSLGITYNTVGNSVAALTLQVAALNGLGKFSNDGFGKNATYYSIEYKRTGTNTWTVFESNREFLGKSRSAIWDAPTLKFGAAAAGQFDIRLIWLSTLKKDTATAPALFRIWLRNVTEVLDRSDTFSGTALLALRAVATSQLQGGAPNVTCMVKGLPVRAYSNETTFVTTWTRNPAWCLLDYMTNSRYGMGAFIDTSMINIQSFIDFATLCNSTVPNGAGGTEAQHMLDLTMDKKKPHWNWVNEILGNYRSAMIYSQGKYKIITDRSDLPVRQVFHGGNIVPGTFQLTMAAADPIKPNQATVTFPNQNLEYNLDTIFVQDSASVLGANDPIKEFDISLVGVSRESEASREGNWQLNRRRQQVREATFQTGLEALAVEPGDHCRVGIPITDFELGYGGRVIDGDVNHLVLDRPIEVRSGYPYELLLWHTTNDSMESRTLATTPGSGYSQLTTITVSPTASFLVTPLAGDRWVIGVTSEDLMRAVVKKVGRDENGLHTLTVEQYVTINPTTPTLVGTRFWGIGNLHEPPPQPISAVASLQLGINADGTLVALTEIDVTPAPSEEGGVLTKPGTLGSVTLGGSHATPRDALAQEQIRFLTGSPTAVFGYRGVISAWNGTTRVATLNPPLTAAQVPASGVAYTIIHRAGNFGGFEVLHRSVSTSEYTFLALAGGTHHEHFSEPGSQEAVYKLIPYSTEGVRNTIGAWELTVTPTSGDTTVPDTPSGLQAGHGVGREVILDWNDNTDFDLSHYELYRGTSNAFGSSTKLANISASRFTDILPDFETSHLYWIRAVDRSGNKSPIHPGSTAGLTISSSLIVTGDVGQNAISNSGIFTDDGNVTFGDNTETLISSMAITTNGGVVMVILKSGLDVVEPASPVTFRIRKDDVNGEVLDIATIHPADNKDTAITLLGRDSSPSATQVYVGTILSSTAGEYTARHRRLTAINFKR